MRPAIYLFALLLSSCTPSAPPVPPAEASLQDVAVVSAVLPVLNATFPFRVEASKDPKDPLGTSRLPTDKVVLKPLTAPVVNGSQAGAALNASLPGNETLVAAWLTAGAPVQWPSSVLEGPGVVSYARVNAKIEGDWWKGLAAVAPAASSLVEFSRPGYSADGKRALIGAAVETSKPPKLDLFYLLERDGSGWVVTNSVSRER